MSTHSLVDCKNDKEEIYYKISNNDVCNIYDLLYAIKYPRIQYSKDQLSMANEAISTIFTTANKIESIINKIVDTMENKNE